MATKIHPIAEAVLAAFAPTDYFRSNRLAAAIADRNPKRCVQWAVQLVERRVAQSSPHEVVIQTLQEINNAIPLASKAALSQLEELSWQSWSSGSFDESCPYLQRAVARLGWATICLICIASDSQLDSEYTGRRIPADGANALAEMTNQCAMAVDMTYTSTSDGRLMVAHSFSQEMETLS